MSNKFFAIIFIMAAACVVFVAFFAGKMVGGSKADYNTYLMIVYASSRQYEKGWNDCKEGNLFKMASPNHVLDWPKKQCEQLVQFKEPSIDKN